MHCAQLRDSYNIPHQIKHHFSGYYFLNKTPKFSENLLCILVLFTDTKNALQLINKIQ